MPHDILSLTRFAQDYVAAWSSHSPEAVASFFADDGQIQINRGDVQKGRAALLEMAAGFYAAYPDLTVYCDDIRIAGDHAVLVWSFDGHHADNGKYVKVLGWEEWEFNADGKVQASLGWYDSDSEAAQIGV